MSLDSYALITLAYTKSHMGITASTYDSLLEDLINAGSKLIESRCNRNFIQRDWTEYKTGDQRHFLYLNEFPVDSITSLTLDGTASTSYTDDLPRGILHRNAGWASLYNGIVIEYTAGWLLADIPYDLQLACAKTVKALFDRRAIDSAMKSEKIGNYSYVIAAGGGGDKQGALEQQIDGWVARYIRHSV